MIAVLPEEHSVVNTLGVAQYRLGEAEEALRNLERSDAHYTEVYDGGLPADVAFLAMAHHALGDEERATAELARLEMLMERPKNAVDEEAQEFLEEARLVLGVVREKEE